MVWVWSGWVKVSTLTLTWPKFLPLYIFLLVHTSVVQWNDSYWECTKYFLFWNILFSQCTLIENRLPSGAANPYLVTAVTIAAGIDGIINKIDPPPMYQTGKKIADLNQWTNVSFLIVFIYFMNMINTKYKK